MSEWESMSVSKRSAFGGHYSFWCVGVQWKVRYQGSFYGVRERTNQEPESNVFIYFLLPCYSYIWVNEDIWCQTNSCTPAFNPSTSITICFWWFLAFFHSCYSADTGRRAILLQQWIWVTKKFKWRQMVFFFSAVLLKTWNDTYVT